MARKKPEKTFGQAVIDSLKDFVAKAERGEPITVRTVRLNLQPHNYRARDVRLTREKLGVSQAVFAQLLAVSVDLVQAWEQGVRKPQPIACRLLDEVNSDPKRWLKRLVA